MAKKDLLTSEGYEEMLKEAINDQFCPECGARINAGEKDNRKEIRKDLKFRYKINYSLVALGILLFNLFVFFIFLNLDPGSVNVYLKYYGLIFLIDGIFFAALHIYLTKKEGYPFYILNLVD